MADTSVIIATFNRAAMLAVCVRAVLAQDQPDGGVDVIVVDNASTDDTPAAIERLVAEFPGKVRGLRETRSGCAVTRNTGAAAAAGEFLVFVDDDAAPHPGWLRALVDAARDTGAVAVGGLTISTWDPTTRPRWVTERLKKNFEIPTPGGAARRAIDFPNESLNPGNLIVGREAFFAAGRFAENMGRRGAGTGSFEDFFLFQRWAEDGEALIFEPAARLDHAIHADRLSRAWLLRNQWNEGRHSHVMRRPLGTGRLMWEAAVLLPAFVTANLLRGRTDVALQEALVIVHHVSLLWSRLTAKA